MYLLRYHDHFWDIIADSIEYCCLLAFTRPLEKLILCTINCFNRFILHEETEDKMIFKLRKTLCCGMTMIYIFFWRIYHDHELFY